MKLDKKTTAELWKAVGTKNPSKYRSLASTLFLRLEMIRIICKSEKESFSKISLTVIDRDALLKLYVELWIAVFKIEGSVDGATTRIGIIKKRIMKFLTKCKEQNGVHK